MLWLAMLSGGGHVRLPVPARLMPVSNILHQCWLFCKTDAPMAPDTVSLPCNAYARLVVLQTILLPSSN